MENHTSIVLSHQKVPLVITYAYRGLTASRHPKDPNQVYNELVSAFGTDPQ
eukprot:gene43253-53688_t